MVHSHEKTTVILQQFNMIMKGIEKFHRTECLSGITEITQSCTAIQENTDKLIENARSQVLTKSQDVTSS